MNPASKLILTEAGFYALGYDNPIAQELIDGIDLPNLNNATIRQLDQKMDKFFDLIREKDVNIEDKNKRTWWNYLQHAFLRPSDAGNIKWLLWTIQFYRITESDTLR